MFETKWGNNQYVFGKRIAGLITFMHWLFMAGSSAKYFIGNLYILRLLILVQLHQKSLLVSDTFLVTIKQKREKKASKKQKIKGKS